MRILYVGNVQGINNIQKFYLTEQRLLNGFTRLGHNVYCFNDRDYARWSNPLRTQSLGRKAMNQSLIAAAKTYEPDLILLSHCKNVTNDSLAEIKASVPQVRIAYTNVDPLSAEENVRDIHQRVGVADSVFVTTAGEGLRQFAGKDTKVHYFPNPVDRAIDTVCAFKNKKANTDLLFLGRALRHGQDHRTKLAEYLTLRNKGDLNCYIGGLGVNENLHYGAEYFKILNNSKMGLCVSKVPDHYLYASDRFSHYLAAGIMTFIPDGSKFEDIAGTDAFVPFAENDELWQKAVYFSTRDPERERIAMNGYEFSHREFSVEKVCQYMIEVIFDEPLSQSYAWPVQSAVAL